MFQSGCSIYSLLREETISRVFKNSGIRQDAVSNLNDILKLYGEFLSSNMFSSQSTAFPIALDLQICFLDQEGKELDYKQFTGNVFIHGWGGIFVCM